MIGIDSKLAIRELDKFIAMSSGGYRPASITFDIARGIIDDPETEVLEQAAVVERILEVVLPRWKDEVHVPFPETRWDELREAAVRARGLLRREPNLREILGDNAPRISASDLHRWVWDGARPLWESGHFAEAVEAATKKVQAETQIKVSRRDVSGADLFAQSFSPHAPEADKPRLRRMPDDGSKTYKSMQTGAIELGKAVFTGIRNPVSHEADQELSEQQALEYLAAISILARWVDEAELAPAQGKANA